MVFDLSPTDKKLLLNLDFNARKSTAELARDIRLSKQSTDYKLKNLEKNGIITGYYPIVNIMKLGYVYGRLWLAFHNLTQKKEEELYEKLRKDSRLNWIITSEGTYDMGAAVWAKNMSEFKSTSENLLIKYGRYIKEKRESAATKLTQFSMSYLDNQYQKKEIIIEEETETEELDSLDWNILKALSKNARTPLVDVAQSIKTSSKVVAYRLKRLEKQEIIKGYRPVIDNNKLGYTQYKLLFYLTNVTPKAFQDFKNHLRAHPNVIYIVEEVGICDLDVELMFRSSQGLFKFIKDLKYKFPELIKDYNAIMISDTLKIEYMPRG